jgi:hypothetical protein
MKVFYVYTHTVIETNTVFYVGMGINIKDTKLIWKIE